jgi:hypothetical protein
MNVYSIKMLEGLLHGTVRLYAFSTSHFEKVARKGIKKEEKEETE